VEFVVLSPEGASRVDRQYWPKGGPKDGFVEIGYSTLEMHQRQGYATEAEGALLSWAFQSPAVQMVVADTQPGLTPSIRVMEKSGFAFVGDGPVEDGARTIRYELTRKRFQARTWV
jgi:RimJ/RimL family protein N-acetyltransferase